ncbi:hypothetical protein Tco_1094049, partial [Tanacetum coccineum]
MGNEPILAFPEGPDDFVVYYDARSKDLEAGLEKREGDCWLTNRWLSMKKVIASCGSKCLAYLEVEVEYQGSSGLLLQPELPEQFLFDELRNRVVNDVVTHLRFLTSCLDDGRGSGIVEFVDREVKSLKRSKIALVKVRWESKRGPEFTWEREDFMKTKYPELFVDRENEID